MTAMWENPTKPRTKAGQRLIASFPANCADCEQPEFIRHVAQSILAIEAEAREFAGHRPVAATRLAPDDHDCFAMNCRALGHEVVGLREQLVSLSADYGELQERFLTFADGVRSPMPGDEGRLYNPVKNSGRRATDRVYCGHWMGGEDSCVRPPHEDDGTPHRAPSRRDDRRPVATSTASQTAKTGDSEHE